MLIAILTPAQMASMPHDLSRDGFRAFIPATGEVWTWNEARSLWTIEA